MRQSNQDPATSRQAGFSLVEVSIVVALIGLFAMVGLPTMQEWLERYRVRTAAQEIASHIQLQRMRAVSQNQDFSIDFDQSAGTYALYQGDPATGTLLDAQARGLPNGVTFTGGGGDPLQMPSDELIFHSDGSLNDSTATTDAVFLGNAIGDIFRVDINRATGRVQVAHDSYGY